jgi:hypothetical protein
MLTFLMRHQWRYYEGWLQRKGVERDLASAAPRERSIGIQSPQAISEWFNAQT